MSAKKGEVLNSIPGMPPVLINPPKGDAFAPRNKYAMAIDYKMTPPMFKITDTHSAATVSYTHLDVYKRQELC